MSSPVTFSQVKEEENERQDEEGHPEGQPADEVEGVDAPEDLEELTEDVETFLELLPEEEREREPEERVEALPRGDRITTISEQTRNVEEVTQTVDLSGVSADLEQINESLAGLSQTELLQNIAQSNRIIANIIVTLLEVNVQQLQALFDILTSVEPFSQITVSGVNDIENSPDPEPVVPESDNISIPTRTLFIKAGDNNQEPIAVGDDEVEPDEGWILDAGENVVLDVDLREQAFWMAGDNNGDVVELLGVR